MIKQLFYKKGQIIAGFFTWKACNIENKMLKICTLLFCMMQKAEKGVYAER
jgi:hypothetical protein